MPRYVGSGDYYTFKAMIPNGSTGIDMRMPTAPMYQDKETYAGRNRMWLKSVRMGLEDATNWDDSKSDSFMEIEFYSPSQNVYNGPMGNTLTTTAAALPYIDSDQFANASFWFAPKLYEYRNDNTSMEYSGATLSTFAVAGGAGQLNTGDTQNISYTAGGSSTVSLSDKGVKPSGSNKSIQLHYDNDCYCPAKAAIVGQLWGSQLPISINQRTFRDNLTNNRLTHTALGNIYLEYVVEPLLNQHIPNHMEMGDEKNRMRY